MMKIVQKKDIIHFNMSLDEFKVFDSMMRKIEYKSNEAFDPEEKDFSRKYMRIPYHK
ncbi:MAG: hypothetical protein GPJ54_18540 [Candidatus Heimdallarchaeota archaeon]|nr:hypothetical protein [Candidatus Heimdallarchaeota archaeon]